MNTTLLIFLTMLSLWAVKPCYSAVVTVKPEITVDSNNIAANNMELQFSPHFREIIVGIYKRNFGNFSVVLHLTEISDDINFKADILLGLYDAMRKVNHTTIPFHAIVLYNKIEELINAASGTNINPDKLEELQRSQEKLLLNTIVPKGSRILESAAYIKGLSLEGTLFQKWLHILLEANETVSNLTFGRMVAQLRWEVPLEELTPLLANLSPYVEQNVDLLLSLYNVGPFEEEETSTIFSHLIKLKKDLNVAETNAVKRIQKINEIIPIELQLSLIGTVCIYKKDENGNRFYIHECNSGYEACFTKYSNPAREVAFQVEKKHNSHGLLLYINNEESENSDFDVYSAKWADNFPVDIKKINSSDEKVVIENMNGTKFLCGSSAFANPYTRSRKDFLLNEDECKWIIEDCSHFI